MGLFKGLTASKERQKAKAFYEKALHLTGNPREIRRIKAIIGNRTKAFFDMTFVEGAKKTEAHQQADHHDHCRRVPGLLVRFCV